MALTDSERVLNRARALMLNKGHGWSKAIDRAAETLKRDEPETARMQHASETPKANQERQFASQRAYLEKGKAQS